MTEEARPVPSSSRDLLSIALRHHGAGDLVNAERLYREVLEAAPDHPDANHLLGVVAHQRGQHQLAVERIRRALAQQPRNAAFLSNLGEAYRAQRQFAHAIDCYRRALELKPHDAGALNNLAIALHQTHRFEDSERLFREAIRRQPRDPEIHVNFGNMLRDRGDPAAAARCYREAIRHVPSFAPAHAWLGVTLFELGHGEAAVDALGRATELDPLGLEAHNNLKRVRWNLDQRGRLHDSFRRACEQLPEVPDSHLNLVESLLLNDEPEQAEAPLARALALAPDSARGHSLRGRLLLAQSQPEEAIRALERAVALAPDDALLREELANALLAAGRHARTVEVLAVGQRLAPRRSGILARQTVAMTELEDPALAELVDYQRFVVARQIEVPDGFADLESFNAALHAELAAQHSTPNHALEQTMRGGTQTLNNLFQSPRGLVAVLKRQIQRVVDAYVASLSDDPLHPFLRYKNPDYVFTGAWSTILRTEGFDGSHIHNEGWMSGTYYVRVPELSDAQRRAGEGHIQFGAPPPQFKCRRSRPQRLVPPSVGTTVLFPSYYWHGVQPFRGDGVRHSVSFDLV